MTSIAAERKEIGCERSSVSGKETPMTISRRIPYYLTIAAMLVSSLTAMAQSPVSGQALEGAWNVALVFNQPGLPPCAPAPSAAWATGPGRGIVIADSCYASESAGYGSWVRTGNNQFAITFVGNSFGPDGTVSSTYKVRAWVSLNSTQNSFTGPFRTEIFDLAGNLLATFTGTATGTPVVVEP
jgi:hypothetical protein